MTNYCLDIRDHTLFHELHYAECVNIPFLTLKSRSYELPERFTFHWKHNSLMPIEPNSCTSDLEVDGNNTNTAEIFIESSILIFYASKCEYGEAKLWLIEQGYTLINGLDFSIIAKSFNPSSDNHLKNKSNEGIKLASLPYTELKKILLPENISKLNEILLNNSVSGDSEIIDCLWKPCPLLLIFKNEIRKHLQQELLHQKRDDNELKFLDLGCGCGRDTVYMASHYDNCKVVAVDRSGNCKENDYKVYRETSKEYSENINIANKEENKKTPDPKILNDFPTSEQCLPGCLGNCQRFIKDYKVSKKTVIIDGNIRSPKVTDELRRQGPYDLIILSRFPYSQEIYKSAASLLRPGGLFLVHQFSIKTFEKFHKPRKCFCLDYTSFSKIAVEKMCRLCKTGIIGKKCLNTKKCGFGMARELCHCFTTTADSRECLSCIFVKGD